MRSSSPTGPLHAALFLGIGGLCLVEGEYAENNTADKREGFGCIILLDGACDGVDGSSKV